MTPDQIAADVAQRYGLTVSPAVVQMCPPRTFTTATPIWDGKINQLVYPDKEARSVAYRNAGWKSSRRARSLAATPEMLERRDNVRLLHDQGLHNEAIATRVGVSSNTVLKDLRVMGLKSHRAPYAGKTDAMAIKTATILRMKGEGKGPDEISAFLGIAVDNVRRAARKAGVSFPRAAYIDHAAITRAGVVLRLKSEGYSAAAIAAEIKCNVQSVQRIARANGDAFVVTARPKVPRERPWLADAKAKKIAARREVVRQMVANGATRQDMEDATGVSADTIRDDLRHLGLTWLPPAKQPARTKAPAVKRAPKVKRAYVKTATSDQQIRKAARQKRVKELAAKGFGYLEIAVTLDVGKSTIHRDMGELGLITNSTWARASQAKAA